MFFDIIYNLMFYVPSIKKKKIARLNPDLTSLNY